jgi:hypothetical protein
MDCAFRMKKYLCEVVTTTTRSDIAVLVAMICAKVVVVDLTMRIHLLFSFFVFETYHSVHEQPQNAGTIIR